MTDYRNTVTIENAKLLFRNFAGREGQFNVAGNREFSIALTNEIVEKNFDSDWNIKYLKARDESEEETPYLPVAVSYKIRPPRIVMITGDVRTDLDEDSVDVLDWADIRTADVVVTPYEWSVNGKGGIKAYLKTLFVTIDEDDLERKYRVNEAR